MKSNSVAFQAYKQKGVTSFCKLLRVSTVGGDQFGFTSLDQDIVYNDGRGSLTYRAARGFMPARVSTNESLSVDNTDLIGLLADLLADGLTSEYIHSGQLSFAKVRMYEVNYEDLTMGHERMLRGSIGEVVLQGGQYTAEYRSLAQQLKQQLVKAISLKCRAQFGDRYCKIDTSGMWIDGTVTTVGDEIDLMFVDTSLTQPEDYFDPGRIIWVTGDNAGAESDVDSFLLGGGVTLFMPLFYPIKEGDTYQIRQDCAKTLVACKAYSNVPNMRAEPWTPTGDATAVSTPGAQTSGASGGTGSSGSGTLPP